MSYLAKRLSWMVGITLLFPVGGFLLVVLPDGPPVDDSDLEMKKVVRNGASDLAATTLASQFPVVTEPEQDLIYEWEMFQIQKRRSRSPNAPKEPGTPFLRTFGTKLDQWETISRSPHLTRIIELRHDDLDLYHSSRALKIAARIHLDSGDHEQASDLAMTLIRLGKALQSAGGSSYQFGRGTSNSLAGVRLLEEMIEDGALPPLTLESLAEELPALRPTPDEFAEELRGGYAYCIELLDELAEQRFDDPIWSVFFIQVGRLRQRPFTFKQNETHRQLCDLYRATLQDVETRTKGPDLFARQVTVEFESKPFPLQTLSGNISGEAMVVNLAYDLAREVTLTRNQQAEFALLELRIALERHRIEHGSWPARLEELVPTYLDRIPLDPFDGKPLRFDAARREIFSIGDVPIAPGISPFMIPTTPSPPAPSKRQPIEIQLEAAPEESAPQ
ncbi:MAG: hypothetical protein KDN19_05890 [Verrucomicrobiae bacterium]|nr:hypothetical protein [Verrucomicrobiae bacterium]